MSYLYGRKCKVEMRPILHELREVRMMFSLTISTFGLLILIEINEKELYPQGYGNIEWSKIRNKIAHTDDIVPLSNLLKCFNCEC